MGIDVNNSRRDHPDRNIWYKAKYVLNNKLVKDAVPQGVFLFTRCQGFWNNAIKYR